MRRCFCRVEKHVNGLQNHTGSETDKTQSDDDDGGGGRDEDNKEGANEVAGKATARRGKKTAANKNNSSNDDDDDDDDDDDSEDDDVIAVSEPRPAKVIAGEVIKQWQTKTRSKGCIVHQSWLFLKC